MKRLILGSSLLFSALFTDTAMLAQESVEVLIRGKRHGTPGILELPKADLSGGQPAQ
jgi:hypothetical protein